MSNISVSHVFPCDPSTLWSLVGSPDKLSAWHPAIATSPVVGDERVCTLADGAKVTERILSHDDDGRSYRYSITDSPLPMRDYVSTIAVQTEGAGARLTWQCQFEAQGAPAAEVESMIRGLYEAGIQGVTAKLA